MSDKQEPQEKGDSSLWGDIARMEAEVYDPEEIATSVYDVSDIEGLKAQMDALKAKRKQSDATAPLALPDDDEDDEDDEDDQTLMYSADKLMGDAQELALRKTALASPPREDEDEDDEDLQTSIVDRDSLRGMDALGSLDSVDEAPAIEVAEASVDAELLAELGEDSSRIDAPISGVPVSEEPSVSEPMAGRPPASTPELALVPGKSPLAVYAPFIALVLLGFLVGYLIVAYMRPPG